MNGDDRRKMLLAAGIGAAFGLYMARVLRVPAPRQLIEQVAVAAAQMANGATPGAQATPKSFRVVKAKKLMRATVARPPLVAPRQALTTMAFTREEMQQRAKEMMN